MIDKTRVVLRYVVLVVAVFAICLGPTSVRAASAAEPAASPTAGMPAPPAPPNVPVPPPFDPRGTQGHPRPAHFDAADLVKRPGAVLPPRRPSRAPAAASARAGAWISTGQGIIAASSQHFVPLTLELPANPNGQYVYTTLKSPDGCLESVTVQMRAAGDVTRRFQGFYDYCGAAWRIFVELTPDMQAKYLNQGYIATQVYKVAPATWAGIVYNWVTPGWETWWTQGGESAVQGWSAFEQIFMEQTGCPSFPSLYATNTQVWNGAWTYLAPPLGTAIVAPPDSACTRSYYGINWFQWPALWSWGEVYMTPGYLLPYPGGLTRRITCIGTGCTNHDAQYNQYSWDFGMGFGEDVVAVRGGTVLRVRQDQLDIDPSSCDPNAINNVNYILVDHGGGVTTQYAHVKRNSAYVTEGQIVKSGAKLAQVGSSGYVCGYHLHFKKQVTPASPAQDLITASLAVQFDDAPSAQQLDSVVSDNWAQP